MISIPASGARVVLDSPNGVQVWRKGSLTVGDLVDAIERCQISRDTPLGVYMDDDCVQSEGVYSAAIESVDGALALMFVPVVRRPSY